MTVQRTYVFRNRHFVVVKYNYHVFLDITSVIKGFKRHTSGHSTVANYRYNLSVFAFFFGSHSHAQPCTNRCRRMTNCKGVVVALRRPWERVQTILLANGAHALCTTCKDFVRISLVTYIPQQSIEGGVVHIVQSDGQFHCA